MVHSSKSLVAILVIGAASFAGFLFLFSGDRRAPLASPTTEATKTDEGDKKVEKPKAEPPRNPVVVELRRWKLPPDPETGLVENDKAQFIRNIAFDPTGTRLTAVTRRNAYCFDVASQTALQSYHQEGIRLDSDGLFLRLTDKAKNEIRIVEAASGKETGRIRLKDKKRLEGKALEQAKKIVPRPVALTTSIDRAAIIYQLGIFDPQEFLGPNKKLFKVGIGSTQPTGLTCITVKATAWEDDEPLVLSSDESMLLVKGWETIEVCYWQTDRLLLSERGGCYGYHNPRFTSDNSHVIAICHEGYSNIDVFMRNPLNHSWTATADSVDLLGIAKRKRTGRFKPPNCKPNTLTCAALSHDRKTLAVAFDQTITLYDANAAFPSARLDTK